MVSRLDSGSSNPGSSLGVGHCVGFFGKTLYSCNAFLCPGVRAYVVVQFYTWLKCYFHLF